MASKTAKNVVPDNYFKLVRQFPLTHITDHERLAEAQNMIDTLLEKKLDKGSEQYLDVLTDLVEAYEEEQEVFPDASEADVLRELMRLHGLGQAKLAKAVGISQSTISQVLTGARSLTKDQVIALAKFFHVSSAAFLPV